MKTKDFIAMLQKEDPTGESHIRMGDGIPFDVELKEGYWDGTYTYIDEDKKYVTSDKGFKVDIHCYEVSDIVERFYDFHTPEHSTWEYIKSKFIFDCSYPERRMERVYGEAKEQYDILVDFHTKSFKESTDLALTRMKEGWKFYQNKLVETSKDYYYYGWKIIGEDGKIEGSSIRNTEGIIYSGLFERLDNNEMEGFYEWKKI